MLTRLLSVFFVAFLGLSKVIAQKDIFLEKGKKPKQVEKTQVTFNLLSPGIDVEFGIFKNQTISGGLGLGLATYKEGYLYGLAVNSRYRYYYNFDRRVALNKEIAGNSGNYIAAAQAIFFSQLRLGTNIEGPKDFIIGFYGLVHGLQRTTKKGFNFNAELGAGYYQGDGVPSGVGPLVHFKFGWVPTKRKSKSIYWKED
jgi:hypothetical protein